MASPLTAYLAGMGTVVAALAVGFSTAVMMTSPPDSQKEQPSGLQKRAALNDRQPAEDMLANPLRPLAAAVSPVITAAQTPIISTPFAAPHPPAPWPRAASTTGQASEEPELAPDPGVIQQPVRPIAPVPSATPPPAQPTAAAPAQATSPPAQPSARTREVVRNPEGYVDPVTGEWKQNKREGYARRKQRRQVIEQRQADTDDGAEIIIERRATTGYASGPRSPLGIFDFLIGRN